MAHVTRLLAEPDGRSLWCGTAHGLFRLAPTGSGFAFQTVSLRPGGGEPIDDLFRDAGGSLWVATGNGLVRRSASGQVDWFGWKDGLPSLFVRCLAADADGRLWAGTDKGLCLLNPAAGRPIVERVFTTRDGLSSNLINDLLLRRNGSFAIATGRGLHYLSRQPGQPAAFFEL